MWTSYIKLLKYRGEPHKIGPYTYIVIDVNNPLDPAHIWTQWTEEHINDSEDGDGVDVRECPRNAKLILLLLDNLLIGAVCFKRETMPNLPELLVVSIRESFARRNKCSKDPYKIRCEAVKKLKEGIAADKFMSPGRALAESIRQYACSTQHVASGRVVLVNSSTRDAIAYHKRMGWNQLQDSSMEDKEGIITFLGETYSYPREDIYYEEITCLAPSTKGH